MLSQPQRRSKQPSSTNKTGRTCWAAQQEQLISMQRRARTAGTTCLCSAVLLPLEQTDKLVIFRTQSLVVIPWSHPELLSDVSSETWHPAGGVKPGCRAFPTTTGWDLRDWNIDGKDWPSGSGIGLPKSSRSETSGENSVIRRNLFSHCTCVVERAAAERSAILQIFQEIL